MTLDLAPLIAADFGRTWPRTLATLRSVAARYAHCRISHGPGCSVCRGHLEHTARYAGNEAWSWWVMGFTPWARTWTDFLLLKFTYCYWWAWAMGGDAQDTDELFAGLCTVAMRHCSGAAAEEAYRDEEEALRAVLLMARVEAILGAMRQGV